MALTTAPAIDYALPRQQDEGDHWIDDWRPEDPVFWRRSAGRSPAVT